MGLCRLSATSRMQNIVCSWICLRALMLFIVFCSRWANWWGPWLTRYDFLHFFDTKSRSLYLFIPSLKILRSLRLQCTCIFSQEFKAIWNFKKEKYGQGCGDLEPWDETYLTGLMKSSVSELDFSVSFLSFMKSSDRIF